MDSFHVQSVAECKRDGTVATEIGDPVSGKDAFDADDDIGSIGQNDMLKAVWRSSHILVEYDIAIIVHDADIHRPCVQIDADIKLMVFFVESHKGPP